MDDTRVIAIGRQERDWHVRFAAHLLDVFGDVDFSDWINRGFWPEAYLVHAVVSGENILGTVGATGMTFVFGDGQRREGLQLGSVATAVPERGRGYARLLMERVLTRAERQGRPVLLFANPDVADFYPRFGFRLLVPQRLVLPLAIAPRPSSWRQLDPGNAADCALLFRLCGENPPHGGALSALADATTILWYLCNGLATARISADGTVIAICAVDGDCLRVLEWLGPAPPDPGEALGAFVAAPVSWVEFGFVPTADWRIPAPDIIDDPDNLMFWHGPALPPGPLCFPAMQHT
nr:GNAT family N-acetyltransferase [uncultured Gellertiella sp.]